VPIEIEKKYRLTTEQRAEILKRLPQLGAVHAGDEFEQNTLYAGKNFNRNDAVIRLRRVGDRSILTFKKRFKSSAKIKRQLEEETEVGNPGALEAILRELGLTPSLVYEKRRQTWKVTDTEIVLDELPFGLFMEIEGPAKEIRRLEKALTIKLQAESATYPQLTEKYGKQKRGVIEARFTKDSL